jgi:class 3 adenylate cyclase/streptogramin lyase
MADLPSGAVTFLFTDIEGSTRLVKQLRDRYGGVLAEHQRILRGAFAEHGGHELDTQGDAFFVAFASARDAVLAAVEAQRAISSYPWPDAAAVRVRMGIHTGQASPVDGRYTGVAIHRAARICAIGHGGQVLVSQATQTLLEDEEDDLAVGLHDLGLQRLKDLDRAVHLYQVAAPGLPTEYPPLRGEESAPAPAVAPALPIFRRRTVMFAAAAAALLLGIVLAAVLVTRGGGGGGLSLVHPNNVGVIDPKTNRIVAEIPVGIRPGPIVVGNGSVWVGNLGDRTLTRLDARSRSSTGTISLDNRTPTGIALGAGAVWIAHGLLGKLSRVDPQFGQVTKTIDVAEPSDGGVVAVGGGAVWAAYGESTLARIDPISARRVGQGLAGANPAGIVFATDVWVANSGDQTVSRFDPATFAEGPLKTISVGAEPTGVAYGAGAIWVANKGDGTVTRIEPRSYSAFTIEVGHSPTAVAAGGGAIWVADEGGTISRIDPSQRKVVKTIDIGNAPSGIAVGNGLIWVTVQAP